MAVLAVTTIKRFIGLSTDTKPTGVPVGATFLEYDTGNLMVTHNGTNWALKEAPATFAAVNSEDIDNDTDTTTDLFTATAQACFIDHLALIVPRDITADAGLTSISVVSDDLTPIVFISTTAGAKAKLEAGVHLTYRGPAILAVGSKIQLVVAGTVNNVATDCYVYVSYRPVVSGGYLAV